MLPQGYMFICLTQVVSQVSLTAVQIQIFNNTATRAARSSPRPQLALIKNFILLSDVEFQNAPPVGNG